MFSVPGWKKPTPVPFVLSLSKYERRTGSRHQSETIMFSAYGQNPVPVPFVLSLSKYERRTAPGPAPCANAPTPIQLNQSQWRTQPAMTEQK